MWVVHPLFSLQNHFAVDDSPFAFYGLLGILSYGFPFASLRELVSRIALATLKEYAPIVDKDVRAESESTEPSGKGTAA